MRDRYIALRNSDTQSIVDWISHATRARDFDLEDFDDQQSYNPRIYTRIPSSSSDLVGTEKAGDIAADTSFLYVVVDNSGTLEWQRVAISTF